MSGARMFGVACALRLVTAGVPATAQPFDSADFGCEVGLAQGGPVPAPQLVVTGAVADANGLTITGVNFGTDPFVTLDLVPLTLRGAADTQIAAVVPVSAMPPGEYLLTVSRGAGPGETASFQLALGAPRPALVEPGRGAQGAATPSFAGAAPAAQVGDRVITVAEVDREWQRTDPAGYITLSRQMYEMRRRIADTMAADEVLAREAAARGLTTKALLAAEIPKRVIATPDSAVLSLYEGLGDRARGATLEQMRPALRAWLQRITEPELAKMAYVEELMKVSTRAERFLVAPKVEVERSPQDAVLGPAAAAVELVVFGDFQNIEYARFARTFGRVRDTFGDRLRLVFKNLPTLGPSSVAAAEAAQCALAQGKFWPYHDALLVPPGFASATQLKRVAADLGLDATAFDTCVDRGATRGIVQQALEEARRYGLQTGPGFLINGRLAPGAPAFLPPFDFFKRLIEEELGLQARTASRPRGR